MNASPLVERMRGELVHRGPDGSGQWGDDHVILGHQRLSILDISNAGSQPMFSASGRLVIAFNGEIYNFKELAEQLTETGWISRSQSDTEVFIECIERWGLETTLDRVDGMFAFALYDRQRKELVLCRDRFGEKPLYYGVQNGVVYFASELKAFDVPGGPELLLDRRATADYFRFGFIPAPLSIYHGFFKVRPAHIIRIALASGFAEEGAEAPSVRYWNLPGPPDSFDFSQEDLKETLRRSVQRRLVSDRPVGAFLSGGIDSSLTCALAAESMSGTLRTFNMSWADKEIDESEQAQHVAQAIGADHCQVEMSMLDASSVVEKIGHIVDEPSADSSLIGMYLVSREARKNFVVALSGDGGDEMFGGYNRHLWLIRSAQIRNRLPKWARSRLSSTLQRHSVRIGRIVQPIPLSRRPRLVADKMNKLSRALSDTNISDSYQSVISGNLDIPARLDLDPALLQALNSPDRTRALWGLRVADIGAYLPDDVLAKVDRASMSVSLEARTAFLSPEVADLAMKASYERLIQGSQGKAPLRQLLDEILPDCNFNSPKTGFGAPFADILRGPSAASTKRLVADFQSRALPPEVSTTDWQDVYERFCVGDDSKAFQIWSAVVFELWALERRHEVRWA